VFVVATIVKESLDRLEIALKSSARRDRVFIDRYPFDARLLSEVAFLPRGEITSQPLTASSMQPFARTEQIRARMCARHEQ